MSLKIEGGKQLADQLDRLGSAMSRPIKVRALREAAEPIREMAAALAPRDDSSGEHLADHIVIGVPTERSLELKGRETETIVEVGPEGGRGGNDFFYGYFQEFGTAFHSAQPFMRPAFESEATKALEILVDELWWALRRGGGPEKFV